jgi:hypothetical protein
MEAKMTLTAEEQDYLRGLLEWQRASSRARILLRGPLPGEGLEVSRPAVPAAPEDGRTPMNYDSN